jgi:hypothetical protein
MILNIRSGIFLMFGVIGLRWYCCPADKALMQAMCCRRAQTHVVKRPAF